MAKAPDNSNYKVIAENRRARFDYAIEDDLEVGIMLLGSEVKSLREGQANIAESYATIDEGELWLVNSYVAPYVQARPSPTRRSGGASCWPRKRNCRGCGTPPSGRA
jgi:SsrA-binding protein